MKESHSDRVRRKHMRSRAKWAMLILLVLIMGIVVEFATTDEKNHASQQKALGEDGFVAAGGADQANISEVRWTAERCGIGSCDEVEVLPDGSFRYVRRLNGDQDHQGRHVRISVGDYKVLHVKLYRYR